MEIIQHQLLGKLHFPESAVGDMRYISSFKETPPYYETFNLFKDYITQDSVFFDIGAHFGCISLQYLKLLEEKNITAEVYAFEVNPVVYDCLSKNLLANHGNYNNKVKCYNKAVSYSDNEKISYNIPAPLTGFTWDSYGSFGIENGGPRTDQFIDIETLSIDNLNKKVDIVKIDVEGYEKNVLLGMKKTIMNYKPVIVIELNHNSEKDKSFILNFLKELGYSIKKDNGKDDYLFTYDTEG
jgi:FkbM family methyltransferase